MINDLDEVLRELLITGLPIRHGEVDISFDQPTRDWSARLSRPTLNIFLHDVRENTKLRNVQWEAQPKNGDNKVNFQQTPIRVDLHYLITAWVTKPADEHRLLTRTLMALFRHSHLPEKLLPQSLQGQPVPIPLKVAQYDELKNPTDIWSVLDNELRVGIICMVTLALNPFEPIENVPLVTTRELHVYQALKPYEQTLDGKTEPDIFWTIGGVISSQKPLDKLSLTLVERGLEVPLQAEGRFMIGNLEAGDYTLKISGRGQKASHHPLKVPSPDYKIEI